MSTHRQLVAIVAFNLGGLSGCARARTNPGAAPEVVAAVSNDLIPPGDVTVYAISNEGTRQVLGSVAPGAKTTLRFSQARTGQQYRLIAERSTTPSAAIRSQVFTPFPEGTLVTWELRQNSMMFNNASTP